MLLNIIICKGTVDEDFDELHLFSLYVKNKISHKSQDLL